MPAHSKKTPKLVAKVARLRRDGLSLGQIRDATGVSDPTIRQWLLDLGVDTSEKASAKKSKPSPVAEKTKEVMARALAAATRDGKGQEGVQAVRERLAQFQAMVTELAPLAMAGEVNPQAISTLSNLELRWATQLAELEEAARPPDEPDPMKQPESIELAASTRAMIEQRVARAEPQRRCVHCGRHPDR